MRATSEKFSGFFEQFSKFLVNWGKNMHTFYQLAKKYAFSPLFYSLSIIFFPNLLFGHIFVPPGGGLNRKIYTPVSVLVLLWMFIECKVAGTDKSYSEPVLCTVCNSFFCTFCFLVYVAYTINITGIIMYKCKVAHTDISYSEPVLCTYLTPSPTNRALYLSRAVQIRLRTILSFVQSYIIRT